MNEIKQEARGIDCDQHGCCTGHIACGHSHEENSAVIQMGVQVKDMQTKTYFIEGLHCANCAAKIEAKLNAMEGVACATVVFPTKQLKITAMEPDLLVPAIQQISEKIEKGVKILTVPVKEVESKAQNVFSKKRDLFEILLGATLFSAAQFIPGIADSIKLVIFVIAYVILGGRIVMTAAKNMFRGHIFDENFLMSIATIGAFIINEYPEAVGVMLFFRIGEYFEQRAVEKSRAQIMEAVDLRPQVVQLVFEGGAVEQVDPQTVRIGDLILVRPGDRIPLDGIVVKGQSRIDTSPITGEPVPVLATPDTAVTSGCMNLSGALEIRVEKVLEESMVSRILHSVENAAASKPKIDRFITRFARIYTPVVVGIAVLTAVIPSLITGDWSYWIYAALTFLVISCPCALVLSVPLAFFSGIGAGSKQGILFKGGAALEALKNIKAVVMDKTGTLTKGNFVVQKVVGAGWSEADVLAFCAAAEQSSTHPIGESIVQAAKTQNLTLENPMSVEEIAGLGVKANLSIGEVLCGNRKWMEKCNVQVGDLSQTDSGTEVFVAINRNFAGYLVVSDTLKEDAAAAVQELHDLGITTAMLTGDAEQSARSVAQAVGISEVYAKLLPEDKFEILQAIRKRQGRVMFVGDGINDAPVLAGADVGAAMGSGADAAIEAADVVFMTSKVGAIGQAVSIARRTSDIAWQNVGLALTVKAAVMLLGLGGFASMWMAVFADTGVAILCILNSIRILYGVKLKPDS